MKIVLEIKHIADLDILLPLLKRLEVRIVEQEQPLVMQENKKPPLSEHIGKIPSLNAEAFEKYLNDTRNEWERPIS